MINPWVASGIRNKGEWKDNLSRGLQADPGWERKKVKLGKDVMKPRSTSIDLVLKAADKLGDAHFCKRDVP